jgi:TPR repeat protein
MAENSYLLGVLVLEGRGGEPDAEEGLGLLRRAAESERHVDAALYLTSYFERADDSSGVAKADQLRGIAAANARGQAFDSEADLLRYAFFLYTGFGVPRDRSEARSLLQEGLNRGVTLPPAIREALESEDDIPFPSGLTLPSPPLPPMPR